MVGDCSSYSYLLVVVQTVLTLLIEAGKPSLAYPCKNIARKYGYRNMEKTIHLLVYRKTVVNIRKEMTRHLIGMQEGTD